MALNATAHTGFSGWLGLVGDAISGPVGGVPWGPESLWAPFVLATKFYCSLCVSRVWEAGAGILSLRRATFCHGSVPCQGPQPLPGPQLRNAPSPPNPRSSEHGETFPCPKEEPSGRNQSHRQLEVREELQSPPA